ncbi:hypothetical protein AAG570_007491 [Ranatra chinensis]|uniref:Uncharacterized protein n=1 Tax=Ranatra chinensis TaxID=642074 RepID=A0ABD0XW15_9HEMI
MDIKPERYAAVKEEILDIAEVYNYHSPIKDEPRSDDDTEILDIAEVYDHRSAIKEEPHSDDNTVCDVESVRCVSGVKNIKLEKDATIKQGFVSSGNRLEESIPTNSVAVRKFLRRRDATWRTPFRLHVPTVISGQLRPSSSHPIHKVPLFHTVSQDLGDCVMGEKVSDVPLSMLEASSSRCEIGGGEKFSKDPFGETTVPGGEVKLVDNMTFYRKYPGGAYTEERMKKREKEVDGPEGVVMICWREGEATHRAYGGDGRQNY